MTARIRPPCNGPCAAALLDLAKLLSARRSRLCSNCTAASSDFRLDLGNYCLDVFNSPIKQFNIELGPKSGPKMAELTHADPFGNATRSKHTLEILEPVCDHGFRDVELGVVPSLPRHIEHA